ncbi:peptidylprolyl isomerase [Oleiphilus messinensis]|nr:peptidylprolyl isomerase [Oleiphilus messinensis]
MKQNSSTKKLAGLVGRMKWLPLGVSVLFYSAQAFSAYEAIDSVLAIVEDGIVSQSELKSRMTTITARLNAQNTPLPPADVMRQRVLEQLILEQIQLQMADREGLRISDAQLAETMANIAGRSGYSLAEFEEALKSEGVSFLEAREQIRRELLISRVQQRRVGGRVRVTDSEVENYLQSSVGKNRTATEYLLGHILITVPEGAPDSVIEMKLAEVQAIADQIKSAADFQKMAVARSEGRNALDGGVIGWRKENELPSLASDVVPQLAVGQVSRPLKTASGFHLVSVLEKRGGQSQLVEQRKVRHILIKPSEIRTEQEAKAKIEDIYRKIQNGGAFAELAKSESEDPISGVSGGDLGWVSPGEMVPEFEQVMLQTKAGELSAPFRSEFGWHILEVQDQREKDLGEEIQASQAREVLQQRKYEIELQKWLLEIKGEAYIDIKS